MKSLTSRFTFILATLFISTAPMAADEPKDIQEVMQRIEVNMGKLFSHIMREEFEQIAVMADKVADHEEPPITHRLKIIAELGTDFTDFKKHDDDVHINSVTMEKAAKKRDLEAVIISYGKTVQSCNNCHKTYRSRIQKIEF